MANYTLNRTYSEAMRQLQYTDPASADTFNPLYNQLLNNSANHYDNINTLYSTQVFPFPSTYAFVFDSITVGNFTFPPFNITLGTVTLG